MEKARKEIHEIKDTTLHKIYKHSSYKKIDFGILAAAFSGILISNSISFLLEGRYLLWGLFGGGSLMLYLVARCSALWQIIPFIDLEMMRKGE